MPELIDAPPAITSPPLNRRTWRRLLRRVALFGLALAVLLGLTIWLLPPPYHPVPLPPGKTFAFTIFDDTDGATLDNVKPVYDLLHDLGIRTTKSVWMYPAKETNRTPDRGAAVSDPRYRAYVKDLQGAGFEIGYHGAKGSSSTREESIRALEEFKAVFGHDPRTYANHSRNRDNVYWGSRRLGFGPLRWLYSRWTPNEDRLWSGDEKTSEYFWADVVGERITYVRNLTFCEINTLRVNPSMPYREPSKPLRGGWFSSSDAGSVRFFNQLISPGNVDRLQRERGVCIVYVHLASGFVKDGKLNPVTEQRLRYLASKKDGWFVPAGELLDYLAKVHGGPRELGWRERLAMEFRWTWERINKRVV